MQMHSTITSFPYCSHEPLLHPMRLREGFLIHALGTSLLLSLSFLFSCCAQERGLNGWRCWVHSAITTFPYSFDEPLLRPLGGLPVHALGSCLSFFLSFLSSFFLRPCRAQESDSPELRCQMRSTTTLFINVPSSPS